MSILGDPLDELPLGESLEELPLGEICLENWSPPDQLERLTPVVSENKKMGNISKAAIPSNVTVSELEERIQEMERQHREDKVAWKLKLETSLAQAKSEKEEIAKHVEQFSDDQAELIQKLAQSSHTQTELLKQVEEANEESLELSKQINQLTALHNKTVHAHKHEKMRLEAQVQKSSAEWGLALIKIQREHKEEMTVAKSQVKELENKCAEKETENKKTLEKLLKPWKSDKEELMRRITAQRTQITSLKATEKIVKEHLSQQLAESQKKFNDATRSLATSRQIKDKEIHSLKQQLQTSQANEAKIPMLQTEIDKLQNDLDETKRSESKLSQTVASHVCKEKELQDEMQKKDEELGSWKSTSEKLEKCVNELLTMEVKSADTFQEKMDSILDNLRTQLQDALTTRKELETNVKILKQEKQDLIVKNSDLEFQLENTNVIVSDRAKMISDLCARAKEQDVVVQKQQQDIMDWKEAATKLEQCVDDLMKLEQTTTHSYRNQIQAAKKDNQLLSDQVQTLQAKNVGLSSELAGFLLDDELGVELESVYAFGLGGDEVQQSQHLNSTFKEASGKSTAAEKETPKSKKAVPLLKEQLSPVMETAEEVVSPSNEDSMSILRKTPKEGVNSQSYLSDSPSAPLWGRSSMSTQDLDSIAATSAETTEGSFLSEAEEAFVE